MKPSARRTRRWIGVGAAAGLLAALLVALGGCDDLALRNYIAFKTFGIIYVSVSRGADTNPGTLESPKRSIDAAIDYFVDNGLTGRVHVAEGTYRYEYNAGRFLQVVEGISLCGGYSEDFGVRDPAVYDSRIVDDSTAGGASETDPNRAVDIPAGVSSATVIDGFTIRGGGGSRTAAVFCKDSSPTVSNNVIYGGTGSVRSFGIVSYGGDAQILNNREIHGGDSATVSIGVWNYSGSKALVQGNYIYGGTSPGSATPTTAYGTVGIVSQSNTAPTINGNTIHGGTTTGTPASTNGIQDNGSSAKIWNNTIYGGDSATASTGIGCFYAGTAFIYNNTIDGGEAVTSSIGVYLHNGNTVGANPTPLIRNNIIFCSDVAGTSYCIYELNADGVRAQAIENNDLWDTGATTLYITSVGPAAWDTADDVNALAWASSNVSVDPVFTDMDGVDDDLATVRDNDWQLTSDSPGQVRTGALDLGAVFTADKDGRQRTGNGATGWSMGAYEY
ncbi:MAG: right-handed parallel beta-helix repeat-containing protein [Spirochaetales bacterium]|nr:right-handed parallel beta-helix repeat-containing protein [Spirochaetales bacterium]